MTPPAKTPAPVFKTSFSTDSRKTYQVKINYTIPMLDEDPQLAAKLRRQPLSGAMLAKLTAYDFITRIANINGIQAEPEATAAPSAQEGFYDVQVVYKIPRENVGSVIGEMKDGKKTMVTDFYIALTKKFGEGIPFTADATELTL